MMDVHSLFRLDGRVALVTGSSQGLGKMLSRGLASAGARVVLNGRDPKKLERAVEEFLSEGYDACGYAFDITKRHEIDTAVERIESEIGPIDILVNNAGIQRRAPLHEVTDEIWDEVLATNLTGAFLVTRKVARGMIQRQRGKVIFICSLMSELGRPTTGPYAAAKGGVRMLMGSMCVEWAQYNIQVNGIGPGYFITEMTKSLAEDPSFNDWLINRTPARRWGDPKELVGALLLLASDAGNFINGQIIYVDGGILAAL
ncbi:short-chain dehydrogenase/reductase SDR [Spirochaeta thermophila DSM 6578]|uniref:Short-chain dehydrogenase/reductase SDR n=1 Tax=Winmispira thermophila (strain ATCC 700085 / DSM 6578 / Z-1203) TaxID=869211 RepID=G0GB97_WINT7|nr:SDR family NAD(P)-dependent oxidoreductase [Spirochaeta thermophila]AEJ61906.1 short-chain dehydrogenase/reductase SDR [Spirochaeta thermophila DSM 6578]